MYTVQSITPTEPVITLDEAKLFAIIDIADDDTVIETLIDASTEYAQQFTNRQFVTATYELYNDCFIQDMTIPKGFIQSISSVEYMDENEVYQVLDPSEYYSYGEYDRFRLHFNSFPSTATHKNAIKITFIAGYGLAVDVPAGIKSWIKIKVKDLYEHRDAFEDFNKFVMPKSHIDMMLEMYRIQSV